MPASLFRREAVDHQRAQLWGEATLAPPLSFAAVTAFLLACVAAIAAFVGTATYARKEHVPGFLAPTLGVAKVIPPRGGTIVALHVAEGQRVARGDPLVTVNVEGATAEGENVDSAMLDALRRQRQRLRDQVGLERRKAEAEAARLGDQAAGIGAELDAIEREHGTQRERVVVAREQVGAILDLVSKGFVSRVELKRRQDTYLSQLQGASDLARQVAAKRAELAQARRARERLPIETANQVAQLEASTANLEARIAEIEGRRAYLLSAPSAGRVSALQAWVGKAAEPTRPLLSIVPEGDRLRAELLVPARAIGFVAPGQPVRLGYDAFPFQEFGAAEGVVETVSRTLLKPDELAGPVALKAPSYRVTVSLARQTVAAYGKDVPLQPDMQLAGDIIFDRRSLLAWLMEPLLGAWRRP